MAETQPLVYTRGLLEIARMNPETADLRVLLVQPSYRAAAGHQALDDETGASPGAHELTVDGYLRQPLAGRKLVEDDGAVYLDGEDTPFGDLEPGERVGGAVVYLEAGSDRLSVPIVFHPVRNERGKPPGTTGGAVIFEWAPADEGRVLRLRPRA